MANGLTIVTEQMDHIRSVSMGIWLQSRITKRRGGGQRNLALCRAYGVQGHDHRTAEVIARQVDSFGGNMDAFTAKESCCFNIKVLDEHLAD